MTSHPSHPPVSALRERMIEDMTVRGFGAKTRHDYVRHVRTFAAFLGRSPDTATVEEVRRFQLHQTEIGMQPPSINSAVSALRFFFTVTLERPDLARRLTVVRQPRKLPAVLSTEEVALLLDANRPGAPPLPERPLPHAALQPHDVPHARAGRARNTAQYPERLVHAASCVPLPVGEIPRSSSTDRQHHGSRP